MASSDGAYGKVELRFTQVCGLPPEGAGYSAHAEMVAGFPWGRLFLDSVEQAMCVTLVKDHAVRHRADLPRRARRHAPVHSGQASNLVRETNLKAP